MSYNRITILDDIFQQNVWNAIHDIETNKKELGWKGDNMNIEKQIHQLLILTLIHFVCMCICQPAGHMEVWWTNPQKTPIFVTEDTYSEELYLIYVHIYTW